MTAATPGDTPKPQNDPQPEGPASALPLDDDSPTDTGDADRPKHEDMAATESVDAGSEDQDGDRAELELDDNENLAEQLSAAKDRSLRLQAELENFRKRSQRLMDEQMRYAAMPLLRDLLDVVDNLHRALDAAEPSEPSKGLLEGVTMVAQQLQTVLERHHCRRIDAHGLPFDPSVHEAIVQMPSTEHPAGTVMQVTQEGYRLHDRVVRPSQVMVSSLPAEPGAPEPAAG